MKIYAKKVNWLVLVTGLWALSYLLIRYSFLSAEPFLQGADTYYYALQIRSLVENGVLKIPDFSPLYSIYWLTCKLGLTCEQTINLWTVLIQFLVGVGYWSVLSINSKERKPNLFNYLIFIWIIISPILSFICIEFPKQAFALIFLPFWALKWSNWKQVLISSIAIILSCLGHKAFLLIAAGYIGLKLVNKMQFQIFVKNAFWVSLGSLSLLVVLWFNPFFSISNLYRINFFNPQPGVFTLLSRTQLPTLLKAEIVLALLIGLFGLLIPKIRKEWINPSLFITFIVWALIPLGSDEFMGVSERIAILLPIGLWISLIKLVPNENKKPLWAISAWMIMIVSIPFLLMFHSFLPLIHPEKLNPDYALYHKVTRELQKREIPMLIAHRGLNFYYKYVTGREAFHYQPEKHWPKTKIWRVVYGITPSEWAYYLPEEKLWGSRLLMVLPGPYSLIREDGWDIFRSVVKNSEDEDLKDRVFQLWLNPSQYRPVYLYPKHIKDDDDSEFRAIP